MRQGEVFFAARGDLPGPRASGAAVTVAADRITQVMLRQGVTATAVLGYGKPDRVTPALAVVCESLGASGLDVVDALLVTAGRYRSYFCDNPACCPPDGNAFDIRTSSLAAEAVYAGQVVLPDRTALTRRVAPIGGLAREAVRQATERAVDRLAALIVAAPEAVAPDTAGSAAVLKAGKTAVRQALARYDSAGRLSDDEIAWLSVLLSHRPVRDFAWERTTADDWQLTLWTDVLRRAEPDLAVVPACLLAFAAWRCGRGPLASVALERALHADPAYPMALLLDDALGQGLPPSTLDGWSTLDGRSSAGGRPRRGHRVSDRRRRKTV